MGQKKPREVQKNTVICTYLKGIEEEHMERHWSEMVQTLKIKGLEKMPEFSKKHIKKWKKNEKISNVSSTLIHFGLRGELKRKTLVTWTEIWCYQII